MTPCTVFACESQPIALAGLERVLEDSGEFRLVGTAPTAVATLPQVASIRPRLVLIDQPPGWRGILQFIGELRDVSSETLPVLWISDLPENDCYRALQVGVRGVCRKTQPVATLLECLREVARGKVWMEDIGEPPWKMKGPRSGKPRLTPREREVVRLVARGLKNREIAEQLSITAGTVKVHLMHVFEKTGLKDRFQLSVRAQVLLGEDLTREQAGRASTISAADHQPGAAQPGD